MTTANSTSSPSTIPASTSSDASLPRRAARELAFQFLFAHGPTNSGALFSGDTGELASRLEFKAFCENFDTATDEFAWDLVFGTIKNLATIDEQIRSHSKNWRIERMPRVDLAILRLASYEIGHRTDIPKSVSINEAVELAKRFGAEGSASFINGILDKFAKAP